MARGTYGIGLRAAHYGSLLAEGLPDATGLGFAEAITENFLGRGGRPRAVLERLRADVQLVFHGVSMSLGGFDELDRERLRMLRDLRRELEACWVSDHLSFSGHGGHHAGPYLSPRSACATWHSGLAACRTRSASTS